MSGRVGPPAEHWYVPSLMTEREEISQRKVDQLQQQIQQMENEMKDRKDLIHKLSRLQDVESSRQEVQDRVLERHSRSSTPRLLKEEMERLYGRESTLRNDGQASPVNRSMINTVIQHRTKEFSAKQQETALQAKYLDKERRRLHEARERVQEQRRMLLSSSSPADSVRSEPGLVRPKGEGAGRDGTYSLPVGTREVEGVDSYIKRTVEALPETVNKIWKMREDIEKHYHYYQKPYNGEMGIRSYEHWQLKDYFMVRDVVDEVVEDFLNLYLPHDHLVGKETYNAILEEDKKFMERQSESLSEKKAIQLLAEEMMLDETGDVIDSVVKEMAHLYGTFRNMTDTMLMTESEKVSTGQDMERDPSDRTYNLVTKAYFSIKENRNRHRKEIWGHSQYVQNKLIRRQIKRKGEGKIEEEDEEEEEEEEDAPDLTILDFNTITPTELKTLEPTSLDAPNVIEEKENIQRYSNREIEYWANITPKVNTLTIAKRCGGIKLIRASPNHRFLAVGTFHGDIIVYDALMIPWRPFRCLLSNASGNNNFIVDIHWSVDSSRLVAVNITGTVQVLNVATGPVVTDDATKLGLPADDKGALPLGFQQLLTLDVEQQDFIFQQGSLAEEKALDDPGVAPVRAAFFPSFSFLGTQNEMVVGLDNGDILKCNFENSLHAFNDNEEEEGQSEETARIYKPLVTSQDEAATINTIGQNVEAELLRGHKLSIIYMTFVEHLNVMVTVDQKGFINTWKYNVKFRSSFGWFIPARKYKLETSKIMYQETGNDKPKVVFTDKTTPGRKPRTRQEIAAQRRRVQNTLDNMQLGNPWHEEYDEEEEVLMQVFAPRGNIAQSGAMFHIVYKQEDTDQLSTYITRLYKPIKVKCTRIVRVLSSPMGTELVFILLFNKYPPKGPHFTIVIVDMVAMELRDFRRDIPITEADYKLMMTKTIISCDVTRVFGPTGSDYLFIIFAGQLRCISLTSGRTVFRVQEPKSEEEEFEGCVLPPGEIALPKYAEVMSVCFEGKIYCVAYARKSPVIFIVEFEDDNVYEMRRSMWKSYTNLPTQRLVPVELRVNTHNWDLGDVQHPAVVARRLLLRKMDVEMRRAALIRDHPKVSRNIALTDKVENYKVLDRVVSDSNLLEREAVMGRRMVSRESEAPTHLDGDEEKF